MPAQRLASGLCCMLLAACDADFTQVSHSGFGAFEPSLVAVDAGVAVAWNDNRDGNDEIYLRLLDANLAPLSAELRLTQAPGWAYEAALAPVDGNKLAVAWYDRDAAGKLAVMLGLWDMQGRALGQMTVSAPERNGRIPVLQSVDARLFMAWVEDVPPTADTRADSTLRGQWFDSDGLPLMPPFAIAAASVTTWNLNAAALDDGRIAIVYDAAFETGASELYLALVDGQHTQATRLSADDGFASKYPDIALGAAGGALTWFDMKDGNEEVYLALLDPLAPPASVETRSRRITDTAGESVGAYLAWNGATLGLAWNDNDGGQHEIHFQSFDEHATPLAAARRLTHTNAQSLIPAIVAHGTSFALAWNEVVPGGGGHDGSMGATRSEIAVTRVD